MEHSHIDVKIPALSFSANLNISEENSFRPTLRTIYRRDDYILG